MICKYNFSLKNESGEIRKKCYDKYIDLIPEITDSVSSNNNNIFCTNDEIINNKCVDVFLSENQFKGLYNHIKDYCIKINYNGNNTIIQTKNVIFQVTKISEQENSDASNISSVDLGKCTERLKSHYNIIKEDLIDYYLPKIIIYIIFMVYENEKNNI